MDRGLSPLTTTVGNIGSGILAMMMLVTVADVVGRRVFNHPVSGAYELSEFMLVMVVFFSLPYCELRRSHITIDLVVSHFRQGSQAVIDSIMYFLFLVTFGWLAWRLFIHAVDIWRTNTVSGVLGIPTFPFILIAALGSTLFSLVIMMHLILSLTETARK